MALPVRILPGGHYPVRVAGQREPPQAVEPVEGDERRLPMACE